MKTKKILLACILATTLSTTTVPQTTFASTTITKTSKSNKDVVNAINNRKSFVKVNEIPNVEASLAEAKNKFVNNYRVRKNEDNSYTIFFSYFKLNNVESITNKISKHTEAKWGVKLKDTPYKELAIAQYLIDNEVEYNTDNYNPDKLLDNGGSCQAIALFSSSVLKYLGVTHEVVTGIYNDVKHMWIYSNGSMHDMSFAVETKDVQYALQSDPLNYKYDSDFKLDQNNTYTPIAGEKILSTGKETFALREDGKVMRLFGGKQYLHATNAEDIELSGGKLYVKSKADNNTNIQK